MRTGIARGSLYGCAVWLAYGALEFALSVGWELFHYPEAAIMPWQWTLIALTLATYAGAGITLGALGGWLAAAFHRNKIEHAQATAILSLALAYLLNLLLAWRNRQPDYVDMLAAGLLCLALCGVVLSDRWAQLFGFLVRPWGAGLLLLGGPWLMYQVLDWGKTRAFGVSVEWACVLGVFLAMFALAKRWRESGTAPVRQLAGALAATAVLVALAAIRGNQSWPDMRSAPAAHPGPNIVLITMDTVRADHLSLYGYGRDTTPHLREFTRDATLYTRAVASSDFTLPTHGSIFTGLYPEWHGGTYRTDTTDDGAIALDAGRPTLAEILRERGYFTAAIAANFAYLSPRWGLLRGFEAADWSRPVTLSHAFRLFYLRESVRRLVRLVNTHVLAGFDRPTRTSEDINRQAFRFLSRRRPGDAPFLLFLNYMSAHDYLPAAPFDTRFEGWDPRVDPRRHLDWEKQVNIDQKPLTTGERDHVVSQYDGGIAEDDAAIGALFRRLREMNLYDEALLIVIADHGESLGDRNRLGHGDGSIYQDQIHVPLIVKYPRQREGSRSDRLVSDVDLLPTVLDVLGSPCPAGLQGQSLRSQADREEVFSYAIANPFFLAHGPKFRGIRRAIFSGSLKLISWTSGPSELYDLSADPDERRNLYAPVRPETTELSQRLDRWGRGAPRHSAKPAPPDRSTIERLKTLGYAQ